MKGVRRLILHFDRISWWFKGRGVGAFGGSESLIYDLEKVVCDGILNGVSILRDFDND